MKAFLFIVLLLAGGAAFYFTGGVEKFVPGNSSDLPDTIHVPEATFMGDEQANPFAE